MSNLKTKELSKLGYTNDKARSLVITIVSKHFKHHTKSEIITLLTNLKNKPEDYVNDEIVGKIAETFMDKIEKCNFQTHQLLQETSRLKIYGGKEIDASAKKQMSIAMSLPVCVQGALMPDAHTGYGLPIGGVLATQDAVIPYAVGVDIGCRMALSIFDENEKFINRNTFQLKQALRNYTHFGMDGALEFKQEHAVLDHSMFQETAFLQRLHAKAVRQIGTSGGGNHFVEFGEIELKENNSLNIPSGKYLALLSHSGSRGLGANIAQHYTKIAMDTCKLPNEAKSLAWLDLNTQAGQEYWLSMNLAGDYAKACHDRIHINGQEVVVHRKGATPAHKGEMGIIPGSMTTAAYLVSGKGVNDALNSASHGAGRAMSRQKAKENMTNSTMKKMLSDAGVTLIGGSVEENPLAYKDIEVVINAQKELVEIEGKFLPKIVRMNKD